MSGLNVEAFVQDAAKSLLGKIAGNYITNFTNSSLGETLASLGNTYDSIKSLGTISADSILNGAAKSFFTSSGLNRVFGRINLNPGEYESNIRPETKIGQGGPGVLAFPDDLGKYYMSFHFKKYVRPAPFVDAATQIVKSIYLPLPRELIEGHSLNLNAQPLGTVGGLADMLQYAAAEQSGSKDGAAYAADGTVAGARAAGAAGAVAVSKSAILKKAVALGMIAGVNGETGRVIGQTIGGAVNPNLSVSFEGPTLREFNFNWDFSPENADESDALKEILNEMKKLSLPALAQEQSAMFLAYPHIVEVRIHPDDLIPYKQCLVKSININYSPNGIPSFFKGTRAPTSITLSLNVQEIEYFLSEDFGGTSGEKADDMMNRLDQLQSSAMDTISSITPTIPGI